MDGSSMNLGQQDDLIIPKVCEACAHLQKPTTVNQNDEYPEVA